MHHFIVTYLIMDLLGGCFEISRVFNIIISLAACARAYTLLVWALAARACFVHAAGSVYAFWYFKKHNGGRFVFQFL